MCVWSMNPHKNDSQRAFPLAEHQLFTGQRGLVGIVEYIQRCFAAVCQLYGQGGEVFAVRGVCGVAAQNHQRGMDNRPAEHPWLKDHGMPPITRVYKTTRDGKRLTLEDECLQSCSLPSIAYGFKRCSLKHKIGPQEKFCNHISW